MINCIKYLIYIRICQASEKLYKASNNKSLLPNFSQLIFNMPDLLVSFFEPENIGFQDFLGQLELLLFLYFIEIIVV